MSVRTPLRLLIGLLVVSFLWPLWVKAEESSLTDLQALRYIASYGDLIDAFGADAEKGRAHYTAWGIKEGRTITFDPLRYAASHPDLIEAFGSDEAKATVHYIQYGYREQRETTFSDLDAWSYIASYADLIAAFATDATAGIRHYLNFGYREGRQILFDALAYIASYSDLIGAFGTDAVAGVKHYITWGYQEGRQILFDALGYLARHADLQQAFGVDTVAAARHFINWGFSEGRQYAYTVSVTTSAGGTASATRSYVGAGEQATITLTPQPDYYIAAVTGCGGSLSGNVYTTGPVRGRCQVDVVFRLQFGDISGVVTAFDRDRPAFVTLVSAADDSVLSVTAVATDGSFTIRHVDDRKDYYLEFEQTGYQFVRADIDYRSSRRAAQRTVGILQELRRALGSTSSMAANPSAIPVAAGERVTVQSAAVKGLADNEFYFKWESNDTASGSEISSYVPQPLKVELIPTQQSLADPQAAVRLAEEYGIILANPTVSAAADQLVWTTEYADRLLQLLRPMPIAVSSQGSRAWTSPTYVELVNRELPNDLEKISGSSYLGGRFRLSADAFVYASPLLARIEGRRGEFFSNRLFRALLRVVTEDGRQRERIKALMQQRYGISVATDDSNALLIKPVTCPQIPSDCNAAEWKVFNPEEFFDLVATLEEFPQGMRDLSQPGRAIGLRHLLRRRDGIPHPIYPQAGAVAWPESGYAEFMQSGLQGTRAERHALIVHEKAHFIWAGLMDDKLRYDWMRLSGWYQARKLEAGQEVAVSGNCAAWERDPTTWSPPNVASDDAVFSGPIRHDRNNSDVNAIRGSWASCSTTQFVTAYAASINPNEDFAESLSAFMLNPDLLRSRALPKYEFIRDRLMQGTLYLSRIRKDLTFEVLNLYPDYTYPGKIKSIEVRAVGGPNEDKKVSIRISLHTSPDCTDNSEAACADGASSGGWMRLYSRLTPPTIKDVWLAPVSSKGDILEGSVTMSRFAAAGWWQVAAIELRDLVGNMRVLKQASADFGWKLYINNADEDLVNPVYSPGSIKLFLVRPGDPLASASISGDERELITQFRLSEKHPAACYARTVYADSFNQPENKISKGVIDDYGKLEQLPLGQTDGATHLCTVRHRVTRYWTSGSYQTVFVFVQDVAGNVGTTNFSQDGRDASLESAPNVTIVSSGSDSAPPLLNIDACKTSDEAERCLRVKATPSNPENPNGETIVDIFYWAHDESPLPNASGLDGGFFFLRDPLGKMIWSGYVNSEPPGVSGRRPLRRIDGAYYFTCPRIGAPANCDATTPVQYHARVILPAGSAPGIWGLHSFRIFDKVDNTRDYDFTEIFQFRPSVSGDRKSSLGTSSDTPFTFEVKSFGGSIASERSSSVSPSSTILRSVLWKPLSQMSAWFGERAQRSHSTVDRSQQPKVVSESTEAITGSRYQVNRIASGQGAQQWRLEYLSDSGTSFASRVLPETSHVIWRERLSSVDLPTSAWARVCGDRVWAVQDGYELIFHVGDRALQELHPGRLWVDQAAETTVVTNVRCAFSGAVWLEGYAFGVSEGEPSLSRSNINAMRFGFAMDRSGRLTKRDVQPVLVNIADICAAPANERKMFCDDALRVLDH